MNTRRVSGASILLPSTADARHRPAAPASPEPTTAMVRVHHPGGHPGGPEVPEHRDGPDGAGEAARRAVLLPPSCGGPTPGRFAAGRRRFRYARRLLRTELSRLAPLTPGVREFLRGRHDEPALHSRFGSDHGFGL
ncbi:hypothetical protein [Streptomyces alkaliphilus]|uniref:hypothetical protein n=1 Tax=Streptomyces alkaliphilus TaxID=1472722 RepID=UPI00117EE8B1|nr:hypothetical protein [Streptomyces alkaliphilus]MQS09935.1 hypothetical protein [Streptomyces alkaliphilus]